MQTDKDTAVATDGAVVRLNQSERIVDLERSGYRLIQSDESFRFGMDAVLLSGFAKVRRGELCVDLGTGSGIIPILMEAKTEGESFIGIEIDPVAADMAARSVALNGLREKIEIIPADLRDIVSAESGRLRALRHLAHVVTANPPYIKVGAGLINPEDAVAAARHEISSTLRDVSEAAAALLADGGRFYMVHRPQRLPEIISELRRVRLEPKRMRPVYPYRESAANMILIEAVKGGGPECRLESPLIVYEAPGQYSREIYDIYGY